MRRKNMPIIEKLVCNSDPDELQLPYPLDELKSSSGYLKSILNLEKGIYIYIVVPEGKNREVDNDNLVKNWGLKVDNDFKLNNHKRYFKKFTLRAGNIKLDLGKE